jgi:hypothetical protein
MSQHATRWNARRATLSFALGSLVLATVSAGLSRSSGLPHAWLSVGC